MKLFITGAGGSLGQKLISKLRGTEGWEITGISSSQKGQDDGISYLTFDELKNLAVPGYFSDSLILHLGFARSSKTREIKKSIDFLHEFTEILSGSRDYSFINLSSQSLYDPHRARPAREEDLLKPLSLYGMGKLYSEAWLRAFSKEEGIRLINLRMASLIGREFPERLVNRLILSGLDGGEITIRTAGERLSCLDIEDAADGILFIMKSYQALEGTYNFGNEEVYSIEDIAKTIEDLLYEAGHQKPRIRSQASEPPYANNSLELTKLAEVSDWRARLSLKESLGRILKEMVK